MNLCIKNSYTNIQEYEKTMTYLVEEEFRELRKMKKNQTIKDIELQFILYSSKEIAGVKKFVWHVTFPLPKNLIPPEEKGNDQSFISPGDSIKIKWDPFLNPSDFKDKVHSFKGTILKIIRGELTAEFNIKQTLRPPDVKDPSDPNATQPQRIKYEIQFPPNASVYSRKIKALKKIVQLSKPMKDVLCGHPIGKPKKTQDPIKIKGLNLNESQQLAVDVACNNTFTLIQGPPGCGKTHTVGALAIKLLENLRKSKRNSKILICGTTNVSIRSILEICGKMISEAGFIASWPISKFYQEQLGESDLNIENNPICKYMTLYQMMQRSQEFASLQKKIFQQQYQTAESMKYQKLKNTLEKEIINETDVIFSTLDSCIKECLNNTQIEAVIVDEAAISIEASLIIPLFHLPNKLILVGDHKQLRPSDLKAIPKLERALSCVSTSSNSLM